jgi:hypothetical protein
MCKKNFVKLFRGDSILHDSSLHKGKVDSFEFSGEVNLNVRENSGRFVLYRMYILRASETLSRIPN